MTSFCEYLQNCQSVCDITFINNLCLIPKFFSNIFLGRSAPCTPSLAFPHAWHQRKSSPGPSKKSMPEIPRSSHNCEHGSKQLLSKSESSEPDHQQINYIVPFFDDSPPFGKTENGKSPKTSGKKTVS